MLLGQLMLPPNDFDRANGDCPDYKLAVHCVQWQRVVSSFVCAQPLKHMLDSFGYDGLERSAFDFPFD
jgi:hypothetical protein